MMQDKKAYTITLTVIFILVIINGYLTFFANISNVEDIASIQPIVVNHNK